jgi:hypothetical protein
VVPDGDDEDAALAGEAEGEAPHYLLDGWTITRTEEFDRGDGTLPSGELTFTNPEGEEMDLRWQDESFHSGVVEDRESSADPGSTVSTRIDGDPATLMSGDAGSYGRQYVVLWVADGRSMEAVHRGSDEDLALTAFAGLQRVPVEEWQAALPYSAQTPLDRAQAVQQLLDGVMLPPAFDLTTILTDPAPRDRFDLATTVGTEVACGWFDAWWEARGRGDLYSEDLALTTLQGHRDWPLTAVFDEASAFASATLDDLVAGMEGERAFSTGAGLLTLEEHWEQLGVARGTCPLRSMG